MKPIPSFLVPLTRSTLAARSRMGYVSRLWLRELGVTVFLLVAAGGCAGLEC